MNKNNNNVHLSVLTEDWIKELRQGDFALTVDVEKAEESFDVASWDTLDGTESWVEELRQDDLALTSQGNSLKWKDTLD